MYDENGDQTDAWTNSNLVYSLTTLCPFTAASIGTSSDRNNGCAQSSMYKWRFNFSIRFDDVMPRMSAAGDKTQKRERYRSERAKIK